MQLTTQQLQTLKASILAQTDPAFVAARDNGDTGAMAAWYNVASATIVWRKSVPTTEIGLAVNYVAVAAMTTANLDRVKTFVVLNPASFDPSRADIRAYMADTFSGALGGQGQATRDALEAMYRRAAKRGEALYTTGTGTTATPAVLGPEGDITPTDIVNALAV